MDKNNKRKVNKRQSSKVDKKAVADSTETTTDNSITGEKEIVPLPNVFFSINDLAKMFKVSRSWIVYAVNKKKVSYCAMGRRKLFTSEQVQAFAERIKKNEFQAGIER